jgi:hypothetical protein
MILCGTRAFLSAPDAVLTIDAIGFAPLIISVITSYYLSTSVILLPLSGASQRQVNHSQQTDIGKPEISITI